MEEISNTMATLTWPEYEEKTKEVLILPVGSTEQHGPHLPLCVDSVLAEHFAYALAPMIGGVVAPTVSYGYKSKPFSGGGPLFPGTIDLQGETFCRLMTDLLVEFARDGFTKILVMNAHFENEAFLAEAMDLARENLGGKVRLLMTNWWDPMPEELLPQLFTEAPFPGWALEHAAVTETSLMMHFCPALVREDRMVDQPPFVPPMYTAYPLHRDMLPRTGVLASAKGSSAEKGRLIVESVLPKLVDMVEDAFGEKIKK